MKKCGFQLVSTKTGRRSAVVVSSREDYAINLNNYVLQSCPADYVVVVVEYNESDDVQWSTAPLMTVKRFVNEFGPEGVRGTLLKEETEPKKSEDKPATKNRSK